MELVVSGIMELELLIRCKKVCQVTNVNCKKCYELQKFAVKSVMKCKKFGVFFA